ncbi:hypothetical protein [Bacteroides sp.]
MMYYETGFWLEHAIAFGIALLLIYFIDKTSTKKHTKDIEV